MTLENESIALKLTPITYGDEAPTPWDDSMVVEEYPAEDEAPDGEEDAGAAGEEVEPKVPEKKVAPEPECELDAAAAKEIALSISVAVDNSRYECETKAILFRPTMMFQSRSYSFELKNIASANMEFEWQVVFDDDLKSEIAESRSSLLIAPISRRLPIWSSPSRSSRSSSDSDYLFRDRV